MSQPKISEVMAKPDVALEMTLRPSLFSEFTGQTKVKERLAITVAAAKQRGEAIDHILLNGPPGLGKTTLAYILAKAMGANLKSTSGPTIEKAGDLAGLLTNLEEGDRKSTRLNSSHRCISYAVFCLKKKNKQPSTNTRNPTTKITAPTLNLKTKKRTFSHPD